MENSAVTRLVFVGGGRLAGILYSTFHRQYDVLGYVDDVYTNAYLSTTYGVPCLGTSAALAGLRADGVVAVVTITPRPLGGSTRSCSTPWGSRRRP